MDSVSTSVTSAETERNDRVVDQLYAAVRALTPAKRALVVLYLDGFSYREIAEVLEMSLGAVSLSLTRSLERMARAAAR